MSGFFINLYYLFKNYNNKIKAFFKDDFISLITKTFEIKILLIQETIF